MRSSAAEISFAENPGQAIAIRSSIKGNTQGGRSVTVCSRIQPPFSRRVWDKEKDHLRLGMVPIRGLMRTAMQEKGRDKQTMVAEGRSDIVWILAIDLFVCTT